MRTKFRPYRGGPVMEFQTVTQRGKVQRNRHVWYRLADGRWKCCLCGGLSRDPGSAAAPDRYEPLTKEERAMCPPH